jgi:hypothetical protein
VNLKSGNYLWSPLLIDSAQFVFGVLVDGIMQAITREQWMAAANRAATSSWVSEALKVASSFRNSNGKIDDG